MTEEVKDVVETVAPIETEPKGEVKQGEEAAAKAETTEESAPSEKTGEPADEPKKKGVQKRIDELTRTIYQERREKEQLMEMLKGSIQKPQATIPEGEPKLENFGSYDDYVNAKIDFKASQIAEKKWKEIEDNRQRETYRKNHETLIQNWQSKQEKAREKYEDYDEIAGQASVPINEGIRQAIVRSDMGPDIAYFLGKNPSEAIRISALDDYASAREIGKIEARLQSTPTPKKASSAPDPITPVGSKDSAKSDPEKMPIEEWVKWRNKQVRG